MASLSGGEHVMDIDRSPKKVLIAEVKANTLYLYFIAIIMLYVCGTLVNGNIPEARKQNDPVCGGKLVLLQSKGLNLAKILLSNH